MRDLCLRKVNMVSRLSGPLSLGTRAWLSTYDIVFWVGSRE